MSPSPTAPGSAKARYRFLQHCLLACPINNDHSLCTTLLLIANIRRNIFGHILGWRLGDGVWQLPNLRHSARCISHGAVRTAGPGPRAVSIDCTRAETTKRNQSTNWLKCIYLQMKVEIEKGCLGFFFFPFSYVIVD
jgi:hypothetical protein